MSKKGNKVGKTQKVKKAKLVKPVSKVSAFIAAVGNCKPASLSQHCKSDLSALEGEHRRLLSFDETRSITGSLDYDKGMTVSGDKAEKWDYAVGYRSGATEKCVWVEVHPASTGEVKKMLGKLAALKAWLKDDGKPLAPLTHLAEIPFVWVCTSAGVSISGNSKEKRLIAAANMRGPVKMLRLPLT